MGEECEKSGLGRLKYDFWRFVGKNAAAADSDGEFAAASLPVERPQRLSERRGSGPGARPAPACAHLTRSPSRRTQQCVRILDSVSTRRCGVPLAGSRQAKRFSHHEVETAGGTGRSARGLDRIRRPGRARSARPTFQLNRSRPVQGRRLPDCLQVSRRAAPLHAERAAERFRRRTGLRPADKGAETGDQDRTGRAHDWVSRAGSGTASARAQNSDRTPSVTRVPKF